MTDTPSRQDEQFDAFVLGAAKQARMRKPRTSDDLGRLRSRAGEFQEYLIVGLDRFCAPAPDYALAKSILGGDFIIPEEIMAKRPVKYTDEQILALSAQLPSEEHLRWLKKNGYALGAAPPSAMSLLDVRSLNPQLFYSQEGGWYADGTQTFARDDKTGFGWIAIKKTPVPNSTNKTWGEQFPLLSNVETVPNAAEFAWFVTTFYEVRGIRLFEGVYVRVSSVDSDGDRVRLGYFGAEGLSVDNYWDGVRFSGLGLSGSRKF